MLYFCVFALFIYTANAVNCTVDDSQKIDCGHVGTTQPTCEASGCCWKPVDPNPSNVPWCFYGADHPQPPSPKPSTNGSFTPDEIATMKKYFFANINIQNSGGVVAAPDYNTKGGSYYFHWMRDSGITYNVVLNILDNPDDYLGKYIQWVQHAQSQADPNGIDARGEPKFMLPSGDIFTGGWCRPQNDGPGLRATALGNYATKLIGEGRTDEVKNTIWGLMTKDCDYVTSMWQQTSQNCDLWEEVRGEFFFTLMAQRKGLLVCSRVAQALGLSSQSAQYKATATSVQATISNHWNGQYLYESSGRPKDSATILGILYGDDNDGFLSPTDPKVVSTVNVLNNAFYTQFSINAKDDAAGVPGILWGRYPGDSYAGGNPWILNTGGLADLYFRQAKAVRKAARQGTCLPTEHLKAFAPLVGDWLHSAKSDSVTCEKLADNLASLGDGVLQRIRYHVEPLGFHLPEQVDKDTGAFANAHDLTWSYGSVLLALHTRDS